MLVVNAQRRSQSEPRCGVDRLPADLSAGMPHGQFNSIQCSIQFNSIHFICQSVVCTCKYVTLKYMNITDSRETPTTVQYVLLAWEPPAW